MKKKLIILFFSTLFIIFNNIYILADIVNKIIISGNQRILNETIIEYGQIKRNQNYSNEELNTIQKRIFETGFFKNINLNFKDSTLYINVEENPIINFFNIQGEQSTETLNKLYDSIKLGSNKIFSDYLLKRDLEYIKENYIKQGYTEVEVTPRVSKLDDNKLNILININKNKQARIGHIYFIGDKKFSSSTLHDVISSSEYGWWKFLSTSSVVNIDRIEYDKQLLREYYLNNGYYDVQITSANLKSVNKEEYNITFSINSGKIYNFGNFKILNDKNLLNPNTLNFIKNSKSKYIGKIYSLSSKKLFLKKINEFISKESEFVEAYLEEIKNNNSIELNLKISESNKQYINRIEVLGNSITEEEVIRRNLKFSEGDSYTQYKKNQSVDNLNSTSIFKKVDVNVKETTDSKVDIDIKVIEQPTGSIFAGAGYGGNGASIGFGINEKNFLGKGYNVDTNVNFGTQKIEGYINFVIPDFNDSDKSLISRIFSTRSNLSNTLYESTKSGVDLSTRYELFENLYFKPGIGLDYESIDVQSTASSFLKTQDGTFTSQRIHYNLDKDMRDKKIGTSDGYIFGFSQELATFFTDVPFIKNSFYGSHYFPLLDKQKFNFKYGVSNITTTNDKSVKLSDRLYIPYQNAKGFEARGFGPRDPQSKDYVGGNNSFYSVASATFPNPVQESMNLDTYFYINALNIWGTDTSGLTDSNSIRSALGVAVDWKSPLGPINLSFSQPLKKEATDKTRFFSFEIGTIF